LTAAMPLLMATVIVGGIASTAALILMFMKWERVESWIVVKSLPREERTRESNLDMGVQNVKCYLILTSRTPISYVVVCACHVYF
jgi:hypothetical protein